MNLTIVIPTKNRLEFFYQIINYYSQKKFKLKLLIIDSSPKKIFERKKKFLSIKKQKKIKLLSIKGTSKIDGSTKEPIKIARGYIKTKYVAEAGDDDFYILSGLKAAISFLEKNNDYIGALGETYIIQKSKEKIDIKYFANKASSINDNRSYNRLMNLLFNYFTISYSVMRTKQYKQCFNWLNKKDYPSFEFYNELQTSLTLSILGKFKKIRNFLVLRTVGHKRVKLLNFDFKNDIISLNNIFKILNFYSKKKYDLNAKEIWTKKIFIRLKKRFKSFLFKNAIVILKFLYLKNNIKTLFLGKKNYQSANKNIIKEIMSDEILNNGYNKLLNN
jgi:glycosyltransferase domain-containing protein